MPWWQDVISPLDADMEPAARARQACLTKPPGSLGRLEDLAVWLAAAQGTATPCADAASIVVFAADHGVVEEGVAAYPQSVTQAMLANFVGGGAAIAVLARQLGARLEVVDVGSLAETVPPGVINAQVARGTANLARAEAMTPAQLHAALAAGRAAVERAVAAGSGVFVGGEMGIGNTTVAAALGCALLGLPGRALAGPGTGLDMAGVAHKATVIDRALARHGMAGIEVNPLDALCCVGGFEIAALAGAYIAAAQARMPVLVDGFICATAALVACRLNPALRPWLQFAHASAEPGFLRIQQALAAHPLLDLGLRLGEGSGAAAALPLLQLACALHNQMATFAEAGVPVA